jgi:hypothetical protein
MVRCEWRHEGVCAILLLARRFSDVGFAPATTFSPPAEYAAGVVDKAVYLAKNLSAGAVIEVRDTPLKDVVVANVDPLEDLGPVAKPKTKKKKS